MNKGIVKGKLLTRHRTATYELTISYEKNNENGSGKVFGSRHRRRHSSKSVALSH